MLFYLSLILRAEERILMLSGAWAPPCFVRYHTPFFAEACYDMSSGVACQANGY